MFPGCLAELKIEDPILYQNFVPYQIKKMSTKIYNAYKVKGSINDLMDLLKKIRKIHEEFIVQVYKRYSGTFKVENYKGIIEKDETLETLANDSFGDFILEKIIRAETDKGINTPLNIDASAVVYFYKKKIYVVFFGLPRQVLNTLNQCPILEDYHYQNSGDQSNYNWEKEKWEEMPIERQKALAKDWRERQKAWDAMIGEGPFYENGLLFEFVPSGYPMTLICQQILGKKDYIPNLLKDE